MNILPDGIEIHGLECYRSKDDPSAFFFIPGDPITEVGPNGSSTLMLLVSDVGAILQMGTKLAVDPMKIESIKRDLTKKFPELDPAAIRLMPAPISVEGATLYLGDGTEREAWEELKRESTSGFFPFNAIFNVQLDAEGKTRAISAINGNRGFLRVVYRASLPIEIKAQTSISGDVRADLINLKKDLSIDEALERIDLKISKGDLKVETAADEGASDELKENAYRLAKENAATMLLKMVSSSILDPDKARIEASAIKNEYTSFKFDRCTDIGTWFPGGHGVDHIQIAGFTIAGAEKEAITKSAKLGFEATDLPIAFVQVESGEAKAKLIGPGFDQVSLSPKYLTDLLVRTNYTDGGPAFETKLQSTGDEGWLLAPNDLGLMKIVLDGSRLNEAGSRDARVHIRYLPLAAGTEDDRTVYLRRDKWIESWYIVTRSSDLAGFIEYDLKETGSDGSVIMHPKVRTDKPEINL